MERARNGPLDGVRVVDLSQMISGPLCGRMLADLGADVVKVEQPAGDRTRTVPPLVDGISPYFAQANAGKRTVCLDLKADGGAATLRRLIASADVLVENFRSGVLARLGLDPAELRIAYPRLVICSITGWGQRGPWAQRRSYAPLAHAEVGALERTMRRRGRARPESEVNQYADVHTALLAANAVLAALVERHVTGAGQHVDVCLAEAATYTDEWVATDLQPPVEEFAGFDTWNHYTYPLGDGSFVAILGNPVNLFEHFVAKLAGPEELARLTADPRLTSRAARAEHVDVVIDALDRVTRRFADHAALEAALDDTMMAAPVRSLDELAHTEWAAQRSLLREVAPGLPVPDAPWRSDTSTVGARPHVGHLGEDNRDALRAWGFTEDELDDLTSTSALVEPGRSDAR